jgi:N-acetylmuramic acid 6-phosphate etherase
MSLPPDRGHVRTEHRHADSGDLAALPLDDAVDLMIHDHRSVSEALAAAAGAIEAFIADLLPRLRDGGRLIYVGAGTSGRLGVLDASECPPTFHTDPGRVIGIIAGGDAALRRSSESREDDPEGAAADLDALGLDRRDTVVGIAAGGTTPFTLGAVARARAAGALTALITCSKPPTGAGPVDHLLFLDTGPELLTGSTRLKAGSATKLCLNVITTIAFTRLGKVYGNLMVDLKATNDKLVDRAIRILQMINPSLSREEAATVLDAAGRTLKTAIVMDRLSVDAGEAERMIAACGGDLHALLDD